MFAPFRPFAVAIGLALFISLTGCSEMINYSERDHEKGVIAYREARFADAAGAFRTSLRQDPRRYDSHYYLGMSLLEMGHYQQAIAAFRSCLETRKVTFAGQADTATAMKAIDGLAVAIVRTDTTDHEVTAIEQTARSLQGPAAAQEYYILGKIYEHRRLPDMAIDYYGRACLADNQNFNYLKEFGLYLEKLQQNAKAEQTLRQAYVINRYDKDVNAALSRLGVIPGPSLVKKEDLARPPLPKGPIPEVDLTKTFGGGKDANKPANGQQPTTPATPSNTAATPRD